MKKYFYRKENNNGVEIKEIMHGRRAERAAERASFSHISKAYNGVCNGGTHVGSHNHWYCDLNRHPARDKRYNY
jgi:hypothetical protein